MRLAGSGLLETGAATRLELQDLLARVSEFAQSKPGRHTARSLLPTSDRSVIEARLDEVQELLAWRETGPSLRLADLQDLNALLETNSDRADRILDSEELAAVSFSLQRGNALGQLLRDLGSSPRLNIRGEKLQDLPGLRKQLESSVDHKGNLLDEASPHLSQVRQRVVRLEEELRRWMEKKRDQKEIKKALQGLVISMRNGRWVYAVRAEYRRNVPGVVHDRSATGSTLFIEPQEIVERGDELSDLRAEERREVTRILTELTREVRRLTPAILERHEALVGLDVGWSIASFAVTYGGCVPTLTNGREIELKRARHPLLLAREGSSKTEGSSFDLQLAQRRVTPLDLSLAKGTFQLVVTGPNTGGKTVVLKTVGLAALMTYCGIPFPAEEATMPVFDAVFADIGDEQSIEQNLSTFSSHVTVIAKMLEKVSSRSLVLIDELGAGTDPLEGAALGEAILEELYRRGAFTVVTTHLGRLKEFAYRHKKCENASMEFDPTRLTPTYRLRTGLAGKSNALIIAERLGIPEQIVERALEIQDGEDRVDTALIEGIERTRNDLDRRTREMEKLTKRAKRHERTAAAEKREAKGLRKAIEHEAERAEEERVLSALEKVQKGLLELGEPPKGKREALDRLQEALRLARSGTALAQRRLARANQLKKGDQIFVPRLQGVFEVRKINKAKELLVVDCRGVPTEVGFLDISWVMPPPGYELEWYEG